MAQNVPQLIHDRLFCVKICMVVIAGRHGNTGVGPIAIHGVYSERLV
jgi:hypothetical protein